MPNLAKKADEICWMRSSRTEAISHEPATTAMQTGNQVTGRPCLSSWASYGLGTMNENLPAFVDSAPASTQESINRYAN